MKGLTTMTTQKRLTDAPRKRLDDNTAQALLLQCLFVGVGEGTSAPQIARFISVQSMHSFSSFRLDEMLAALVKSRHINVQTITTKGGRIYRKYELCGCGLILLAAFSHLLPRDIKKDNAVRFAEINAFVLAEIEEQKAVNKIISIGGNDCDQEAAQ